MTWNKAAIRKDLQVVVEDNIWLSAYINDVQMSNCLHIFITLITLILNDYTDSYRIYSGSTLMPICLSSSEALKVLHSPFLIL